MNSKRQNNSRGRYSLFNALSSVGLTLVNGLLGIVVTRIVIGQFGSDFNGINSAANQIVNVLLVLEGGFTLASNVALFSPLAHREYDVVNGILSATRKSFRKVGLIFLGVGFAVAAVYACVANSDLPMELIATVITMAVVPQAFNLFYCSAYRVLLQTQQKEYVISLFTMLTVGLGHITNIVMILSGGTMWMVRFVTMVFALFNSLLIVRYVRRRAPFMNLREAPRRDLIKGTKDVMVQRITGVIYRSAPILFLSVSLTGGTELASVYAVYNNVFVMIKSLLNGVIDAPRLGIGQMLTERKRDEVWPVFAQYEYAAFLAVFTLLTTACTLILPFIKVYTYGVTDINYYDTAIAILMVCISSIEMIHIPSGHLINMSGEFKVSKNIQMISCVVLLIGMSAGGSLWGIYGMLGAVLLCAALLAVMEMTYIHTMFFRGKLPALMRLLLPLLVAGVFICAMERRISLPINGYLSFAIYCVIFATINGLAAVAIGFLFNRRELVAIAQRLRRLILKR